MNRQEKIRAAVQRGFELFKAGKLRGDDVFVTLASLPYERVPDCTDTEVQEALEEVADDRKHQVAIAKTLQRIAVRHDVRPGEHLTELVNRAAEAGDEDALALVADGFLGP